MNYQIELRADWCEKANRDGGGKYRVLSRTHEAGGFQEILSRSTPLALLPFIFSSSPSSSLILGFFVTLGRTHHVSPIASETAHLLDDSSFTWVSLVFEIL